MRLPFVFLAMAAVFRSAQGSAWVEIPDTRSPNGQYALFYEKTGTTPNDVSYALRFLGPSLAPVSPPLVPDLRGKVLGQGNWKTEDDFDSAALLTRVASQVDAASSKMQTDPAFSADVQWSSDSNWVSLEGGEHKFWHMCAWHLVAGRFQQVDLSREGKLVGDYFDGHQAGLKIEQLGMERKVMAIRHRNYDWAYVAWLRNGVFAVDGYPYLLVDKRWGALRQKDRELYFIIDCQDILHPRVAGLCQ